MRDAEVLVERPMRPCRIPVYENPRNPPLRKGEVKNIPLFEKGTPEKSPPFLGKGGQGGLFEADC